MEILRTDADRHSDPRERSAIERQEAVEDKFIGINERLDSLEMGLVKNTEVTQQIRDILTSFRIMGIAAKGLTVAVGAWVAIKYIFLEWMRK